MTRLLLATATAFALAATPAMAITFNYTGSTVSWTVPVEGTYEIVAVGAKGGDELSSLGPGYAHVPGVSTTTIYSQAIGGLGALVGGRFTLSSGIELRIAVGGAGMSGDVGSADLGPGGSGGGGTFVVRQAGDIPLVVAGGGGGANTHRQAYTGPGSILAQISVWGANGGNANTGREGLTSRGMPLDSVGLGGPSNPIFALTFYPGGGSGGGFYSDGGRGSDPVDMVGLGGLSWLNGLAGGIGCFDGQYGGFGGGGGGGCLGGGGGGGYSGGAGGNVDFTNSNDWSTWALDGAGGGGGSYNADTVTGWAQAGIGTGHGYVTITRIEEVTTPEPASATLALLGLFGLAALRRRR